MSENVLVIVKEKWLRGDGAKSLLLDDNGNMCCLGFDALACGLTPEQIRGVAEPVALDKRPLPAKYLSTRLDLPLDYFDDDPREFNSSLVNKAIEINDATHMTDDIRMGALTPVLMKLGGYDRIDFI